MLASWAVTASLQDASAEDRPAKQSIPDRFTAGYDLSNRPRLTLAHPYIFVSPGILEDGQKAAFSIVLGGSPRIETGFTVSKGSLIPIHGKLFSVAEIRQLRDETILPDYRCELVFAADSKSELLKDISPNCDTYFLPIRGNVQVAKLEFDTFPAPKSGLGMPGQAVIMLKPWANKTALFQQIIGSSPATQVISGGDVIRYGKRGLKVRRIVPCDDSKNVVGWIEVFAEEVSFTD